MAKKNAYYFSHDCNARLDEKMLAVRMKHGVEGYGVYFMLIERLAEATDHMSAKDYTAIAFDFRCGTDIIRSVIEDFGLFRFTEDGAQFYSESLLKRMAEVDELREKRRAAINTRWQREKGKKSIAENDTNVLQNEYKCNTCLCPSGTRT